MGIKYMQSDFRLPQGKAVYWRTQLQDFTNHMGEAFPGTARVEFCKQDKRGALSITLFNDCYCVHHQKLFTNKDALLGYVQGYNSAKSGEEWL